MSGRTLAAADLAVGLVLVGAATLVLIRRPGHRVGLLLGLASATWFVGDASAYLVFLHRGPMVHLHLSYPTGRLHRWPTRLVIVGAYAWAVAEGWASAPSITAAVAVVIALAALDTYLRTSGPARKAGLPALIAALMFASVVGLGALNQLLDWQADDALALAYDAVMILVAGWLALDLLHGGWTDATVADLVTQLGGDHQDAGLEAELRRALGDATLRLGYARPDGAFLDEAGDPIDTDGREQAVTRVTDEGQVVAVLVHDRGLLDDPALLSGAVAALRLAVANQRLRDDIATRATELTDARRRLVEATDEQRRLLLADLADGPARDLERAEQLLRTAVHADPDMRTELRALTEATAAARVELGRFAHGLRPEVLATHGLQAVLPADATVTVGRLPEIIESAVYFMCSEAMTNATKHARARDVHVAVRQVDGSVHVEIADDGVGGADPAGGGLQGLADRVAALGGTFEVTSPPGHGTIIAASIPTGGAR
ncbi:sensor histidine kinase [Cellulomonas sp. P5_E12]